MEIKLKKIKIRDLVRSYEDKKAHGVFGYDGKLNIRPAYQREFVYKDKQRAAVIESITKEFPLNVMYWMENSDDTYELMDGQQRSISICQYVDGDFSVNFKYFHNLDQAEKDQILDYKLMVYFCNGTDAERLDWFRTINISGEKLTNQELLNAVYTGPWLTDAKDFFSKNNCSASVKAKKLLRGSPIRQDYLETTLKWISEGDIEVYMAKHQNDKDANAIWEYFEKIIDWFEEIFPTYYKEMKGLPIGELYNAYNHIHFDNMDDEVEKLMSDEEVTKKKGIFAYLLSGDEKHLNIRAFSDKIKRELFEVQDGVCTECDDTFKIEEMEADHILAWSKGGKTEKSNGQMLCKKCNRTKSAD